jgi:catechol 2,3-dioxygenase-like lactoylglutathione lyase family enzyme
MEVSYAIVFVRDMSRSVAFYRDRLGLPLLFESSHWSEFATGEATLALHLAEAHGPEVGQETPGSCRPGFRVTDLDAFHQQMLAAGVPCVQEPKEVFGSRLAQYSDPDGLVFSVGERRGS